MNVYRFVYSYHVDIKAENEEEARTIFEELDLDPILKTRGAVYAYDFRDVIDVFEVNDAGVRKYKGY